jgi:hypothetical protein
MAVVDAPAVAIDGHTAQALRRRHDLHAALGQGHRWPLQRLAGLGCAGDRLRVAVQHHGMEAIAAVERLQPVDVPHVDVERKDHESLRLQQLLGDVVLQRGRRKLLRVADIGPDPACELPRRIRLHAERVVDFAALALPGDQAAASRAVEAQPVPGALQVAFQHAPSGELDTPMRAPVVNDVRLA